ncbi:hypothetical protein ALI44B_04580 [Leifsonia sp. ALI-44-B]|uniref:hypothetical protein n=1 Tax=Leifsonia sp. ALI-44-B TaxID=1933776 RepID=UPI00097C0B4D|nr:hypothetical protein [Leifsonia sp. ALI-44-B]ONI63906.1 hypothetical protein ALI44B_04580 [Leifsonia sp. ALI-44-B]
MVAIAPKGRVFKNYLLKIATDSYEKAINSAALTPTVPVAKFKGGTPDAVIVDTGIPEWKLDLSYLQDWETAGSLSIYLNNNIGKQVAMEFSPHGTGPKFTATVLITPGAVGGAVDAFGVSTVSLEVVGQPVYAAGTVT